MSDLRKAAEMALEALSYHFDNEDDYLNWKYPLVLEAKQALRQALAQPEQELGQYEQELIDSSAEQYQKELAMKKFSKVNQEIEEAIKKGTKAWADVPDAPKWVDELRGGEEQEPFIVDRGCWERGCMAYDWRDGNGVNISAECVDETAKCEHQAFYRLLRIMGTFDLATGHAGSWDELLDSLEEELRDVLGHLRERRKWVGLTDEEIRYVWDHSFSIWGVARLMEEKLKEKNT